jgi:glutamine amidotransferase
MPFYKVFKTMCELFAMSAKYPTKVSMSMDIFASHGGDVGPHKDGWGVAYYQGNEAWQLKAAESAAYSDSLKFVRSHAPETNLMISHIRLATHGHVGLENTQPFSYPMNKQRITFAHNGHVPKIFESVPSLLYTPLGTSDSEVVFSTLLSFLETRTALSNNQLFNELEAFLTELADLGPLNIIFSDGDLLFAFSNKRTQPDKSISAPGMHMLCRQCSSSEEKEFSNVHIEGTHQNLVLFSSVPLNDEPWQPMEPNRLYVAQNGMLIR